MHLLAHGEQLGSPNDVIAVDVAEEDTLEVAQDLPCTFAVQSVIPKHAGELAPRPFAGVKEDVAPSREHEQL